MLTSVAVSPDDVKRACCAYFNVEMEELEGLDRSKKIATARHVGDVSDEALDSVVDERSRVGVQSISRVGRVRH